MNKVTSFKKGKIKCLSVSVTCVTSLISGFLPKIATKLDFHVFQKSDSSIIVKESLLMDSDDSQSKFDPFTYKLCKRVKTGFTQRTQNTQLNRINSKGTSKPRKKPKRTQATAAFTQKINIAPGPATTTQPIDPDAGSGSTVIHVNLQLIGLVAVCPVCQVPLRHLKKISPQGHIAECEDGSYRKKPACPEELLCCSDAVQHYTIYDHSKLAHHRSRATRAGRKTGDDVADLAGTEEAEAGMDYNLALTPTASRVPSSAEKILSRTPSPGERPLFTSTRRFCSPIKVTRRPSRTNTPQQEDPSLSASQVCPVPASLESVSLLSRQNTTLKQPQFETSTEDLFDDEVQNNIQIALNDVNQAITIKDRAAAVVAEEEIANRVNEPPLTLGGTDNNPAVVAAQDDLAAGGADGGEHVRVHEASVLPGAAPGGEQETPVRLQVERDSQEMQINLRIAPGVQCSGIRLAVPLQVVDSNDTLAPVNMSASYTETKSPLKQANITSFLQPSPLPSGLTVKPGRAVNLAKGKQDWKKIMEIMQNPVKDTAEAKGSKENKGENKKPEKHCGWCPWCVD